jgi:hypothetical protein
MFMACSEPMLPADAIPLAPAQMPVMDGREPTQKAESDDDSEQDASVVDNGSMDEPAPAAQSDGDAPPKPNAASSAPGGGGAGGDARAEAGAGSAAPIVPPSSDSGDAGMMGQDGGATGSAPDIVGTWYGPVTDSLGPMYNACLQISQTSMPGPGGAARYAGRGINCRSELAFVAATDNVFSFDERIVNGTGCNNGDVHLTLNGDGSVKYEWFREGIEVPAQVGPLDKVDSCP